MLRQFKLYNKLQEAGERHIENAIDQRPPAIAASDSTQAEVGEKDRPMRTHIIYSRERKGLRFLRNASLLSCSLLLSVPLAGTPRQREGELIVEKKAAYIPAGSGQRPFDVTRHVIPLDQIQSGGPPKNGIPALDHPVFVSASEAERSLKADDIVLGVEFTGIAKAYPVRILNWHEVVNDDVGAQPVLISWCPLCGSGVAYDPRTYGHLSAFGVSGLLYQRNLLLFDHATESLWSQLLGRAVAGPLAGTSLRLLPVNMTTWRSWKAEHSQTLVLSFQTGYKRDYATDPYSDRPLDRRMALVISSKGQTKIYPYSELKKAGPSLQDEIGGLSFIIRFDAKQQSATVQALTQDPPPHFVAFLGNVRAFFPNAAMYKAR